MGKSDSDIAIRTRVTAAYVTGIAIAWHSRRIGVSAEATIASRLKFIGLDQEQRATLRGLRPLLRELLPGLLDRFYDHIGRFSDVARLFPDAKIKEHAKSMQIKHWEVILAGDFDETYVKSVTRIGEAHNRLGLEPRWYIGGYSFILRGMVHAIETQASSRWRRGPSSEEKSRMVGAVVAAAMLDMDIAISVYLDAGKREKSETLDRVATSFRDTVGKIVDTVSATAGHLETAAGSLTKTADAAQRRSSAVAAASEEASTNVQTVAAAAEEMAASVTEIARQVQESSRISGEAVSQAQKTDERMTKLSEAANRIGDVTKLITSIAEQTNLLALNATIEAARAGVAGKGFAVVAQEVKQLAAQTAKATNEISGQINEMQGATQDSVAAIKEIGGTIARISDIAVSIAAAVKEQSTVTLEISRNVQQAAAGTNEVASNITEVSRNASETGAASSQVLSAAKSLAQDSNNLKSQMERFLTTVRAA
jgi:methyl-accepting chemotaxis protein